MLLCIVCYPIVDKKRNGRRIKVDLNPDIQFGAASVMHEQFEGIPMVSVRTGKEPPTGESLKEPVAPKAREKRLDLRVT